MGEAAKVEAPALKNQRRKHVALASMLVAGVLILVVVVAYDGGFPLGTRLAGSGVGPAESQAELRDHTAQAAADERRRKGRRSLDSQLSGPASTSDNERHVVWLMSFPNSGTSYTISNTQHITNTSAASNYGQDLPTESLVRVRPDIADSPFLLKPERSVPNYVLTKTHCTGFCDDCKTFFVARDDFRAGCGESHVAPHDKHYYNATALVKKAVHLFRNPFDNLVSRKHLGVQIRQRDMGRWNGDGDVIATDTPEGLLAWCQYVDSSVVNRAVGWSATSAEFRSLFRSIPCAAEIYRYVQWHNRAIETTQSLQLPVHYMYYEDYSNAYNETVLGLLNFLELNMTRAGFDAALPFDAGQKSYDGLFQHRNISKTAMTAFLRRLASNDTWHHVRRYVDSWYDESKQQEGESRVHI